MNGIPLEGLGLVIGVIAIARGKDPTPIVVTELSDNFIFDTLCETKLTTYRGFSIKTRKLYSKDLKLLKPLFLYPKK